MLGIYRKPKRPLGETLWIAKTNAMSVVDEFLLEHDLLTRVAVSILSGTAAAILVHAVTRLAVS